MKVNGLADYEVKVSDPTFKAVIKGWTKEAGVRGLERKISTIARKLATEVVTKDIEKGHSFNVTVKSLEKHLGPVMFDDSEVEKDPSIGLVNGLAWTSVGGEILNIEVVTVPGTGKIEITGKLGEVMQESAKAALSYVRSISDRLGIDHKWYTSNDIHIHVPEGATPKDGPSAGITLATALTSAIAGITVRQDVAMTGEITLRGRVLPIGGLKEKMLAGKLSGVKKIIFPKRNEKDLIKIPKEIKDGLELFPCEHVEDVLKVALNLKKPEEFMKRFALKVIKSDDPISEVAN